MRRVTRNAVTLLVVVLVGLLALGALPGLLQSGAPYYVTADPLDESAVNASGGNVSDATVATSNGTVNASAAVNGSALSERRFPYTTEALRNGTSDPYWRGPIGLKEAFTHSPFDEIGSFEARNASAVTSEGVLVRDNATFYRVAVAQRP